jgi:4-carboxymuconolactone decarboxylase
MNKSFTKILTGLFIAVFAMVVVSDANAGNNSELNAREKAMIPISAFTASGKFAELKTALSDGLDAGLTVNEIKEILVQLYVYAGFPRSLNGINAFMDVMADRKQRGIKDNPGKEASPLPAGKTSLELGTENQTTLIGQPAVGKYIEFAPVIDQFLKAHLFGDIFGRDVLDFKTREIVTISALANMEGLNPQLQSHFKAALNIGLTESKLKGLISIIESKVGKQQADNACDLLASVLGKERAETNAQKISVTHTASQPPSQGPGDKFTGSVRIDTQFRAHEPANFYGANVIFETGSRTAWHTHELGQLLIITSGVGLVQRWGDPVQKIRKGDIVWIPPHQKHWHGAAPDGPMTHIAIVEQHDIPSTQWLEKVSDEQYCTEAE